MTPQPFRNRAVYRNHTKAPGAEVDPAIVAACVPLWRHCAERAHSRYGGEKPGGNNMGRDSALYSVDDRLREHGITWAFDRHLYQAYEKAVRLAARRS